MAVLYDPVQNDIIAAIATGMSDAGIGIIRVSGPGVLSVVQSVIHSSLPCTEWKPNSIHYAHIVDPQTQEILDEVLISWMKAPHSYTCEDTIEINTHGGQFVMQKVLSAVLRTGVRTAEPGEFTKRAFLNGRIDLSEAEAVMDLIHSQNEFSRRTALSQLSGSVSASVQELRSEILHETAFIEAALDDPEHYTLDDYSASLFSLSQHWVDRMNHILKNSENGMILRSGISTVILGKPNSGKSSLLNALTGIDRAIVTDIPGTTRDTLVENVRYGDLILKITDTAGIRSTDDVIEKMGVERSLKAVDTAQLILMLVDSSVPLSSDDFEIAGLVADAVNDGKQCILLLTKSDLPSVVFAEDVVSLFDAYCDPSSDSVTTHVHGYDFPVLSVSSKTEEGFDQLFQSIQSMFLHGIVSESTECILSGERQLSELRQAIASLQLVQDGIRQNFTEDLYSIDLMNAYNALGRILGLTLDDDLIDEIFSQFCMGK